MDDMSLSKQTSANIYPCLFYDDPLAAIEFLERAFGFQRRVLIPDAERGVMHSELTFSAAPDAGVSSGASSRPDEGWVSPRQLPRGAVNQMLSVQVDDPDAHFARALAAGAVITRPLRDESYGSRGYICRDPEGNFWCFAT